MTVNWNKLGWKIKHWKVVTGHEIKGRAME